VHPPNSLPQGQWELWDGIRLKNNNGSADPISSFYKQLMQLLTATPKCPKVIVSVMVVLALITPLCANAINDFSLRSQSTPAPASTKLNSPASVNGKKITTKQLDEAVNLAISNGAKNNSQLRETWLTDLIVKELILQDAQKTNLATEQNNELKIRLAAENNLVDLWFNRYLASHPVTDGMIKSQYDGAIASSKNPINVNEYELSQIVVSSKAEATKLILEINNHASFEYLAKEYSLDQSSRQTGGLIGWQLPSNLVPAASAAIVGLSNGNTTNQPISIGGNWCILKILSIRPYKLPDFEVLRLQIIKNLITQAKQQAIDNLMAPAKIIRDK